MPRNQPTALQGEQRREDLIRIAIDVFGEAGYAGGRIDEVARRAGIRRPSVLYHFSDKASLYAVALASVVCEISDRVLATEDGPSERLEAISDAWIDFVIDRPSAARLLLRQMIDAEPVAVQEIAGSVRALLDSIQSAIDERVDSENSKPLAAAEFALILSSTSLVWVASRSAVKGALGLDTLAPTSIQRHRTTLHALIRQLLEATSEATKPARSKRHPSHDEVNRTASNRSDPAPPAATSARSR